MKKDILTTLKKNSFAVALFVLGLLIFYWIRDYKEVPSGIGPAFFPRIVAFLMIALSIVCILMPDNQEEKEPEVNKSATLNIVITTISLIVMVGVMKYIHPLLGILLFLAVYLKIIAKLSAAKTAIITVIGTGILYLVILTLRIPM